MSSPFSYSRFDLPQGWNKRRLGSLLQFRNGQDISDTDIELESYPVYGSGGEFKRTNQYLFDGPSILFGRKGTIDKPLLVNGRFWTVDTMFYTVPGPDVDPRFVHYWALVAPLSALSTNTAVPSMTSTDLAQLYLAVPPLPTQRAIADYLDRETAEIDGMRADLDEMERLLRERRTAFIGSTVRQVSSHGKKVALQSVASIHAGDTITSSKITEHGEYHVYGGNGVRGYCDQANQLEDKVLVGRQGALCGNVHLARGPFYASEHALVIEPRIDVCLDWLTFVLQDQKLGQLSMSAAQPGITASAVGLQRIEIPPLAEQRRIADEIDRETTEIDSMLEDITKLRDLLAERRAAVISAAVTGQIDIPDSPTDKDEVHA